jgi:hypothetical protein
MNRKANEQFNDHFIFSATTQIVKLCQGELQKKLMCFDLVSTSYFWLVNKPCQQQIWFMPGNDDDIFSAACPYTKLQQYDYTLTFIDGLLLGLFIECFNCSSYTASNKMVG